MSTPGRFIAVVGASGVGKDSVIDGLCAANPSLIRARRVITRAAEAGGEDFDSCSITAFDQRRQSGDFLLSWGAHGLLYGIPRDYAERVVEGHNVIANLSRAVLPLAVERLPTVIVLNLTAAPETLAARLGARGREDDAGIASRLGREGAAIPQGIPAITISNDGPIADTIVAARAALYPVNA